MIKTMKTIKHLIIGCGILIVISCGAQAGPSYPVNNTVGTSDSATALITATAIKQSLRDNGQRVIGTEIKYINKDLSVIAIKSVKDYSTEHYYYSGR